MVISLGPSKIYRYKLLSYFVFLHISSILGQLADFEGAIYGHHTASQARHHYCKNFTVEMYPPKLQNVPPGNMYPRLGTPGLTGHSNKSPTCLYQSLWNLQAMKVQSLTEYCI